MTDAAARSAFAERAAWCKRHGSPFTAALCSFLGERLDDTAAAGECLLAWAGDPAPGGDDLPLRLCGASARALA